MTNPIIQGAVSGVSISGSSSNPVVSELFTGSAKGAWYDPSDLSTMFEDAYGKVPVTSVERPVGLILDKSQGLALGPEMITNGNFSNGYTGWSNQNAYSSIGSNKLIIDSVPGLTVLSQNSPFFSQLNQFKTYKLSFTISDYQSGYVFFAFSNPTAPGFVTLSNRQFSGNGTYSEVIYTTDVNFTQLRMSSSFSTTTKLSITNISLKELSGNHAFSFDTTRPTLSARVNLLSGTDSLYSQSALVEPSSYKLRFEGTGSITLSGSATGTYTQGTHTIICTAGLLALTVTGQVLNADLRLSNAGTNLPNYQEVDNTGLYAVAGFPKYLNFNGSGKVLYTNNRFNYGNNGSTEKVTVLTGTKQGYASGSFIYYIYQLYPQYPLNSTNYDFGSGGFFGCYFDTAGYFSFSNNALISGVVGYGSSNDGPATAIPNSIVTTAVFYPKSPVDSGLIKIRINGSPVGTNGVTNRTYLVQYLNTNTSLTLGSITSNTLSSTWKGKLYSFITVGKEITNSQRSNLESYIANKMGGVAGL